MIQQTLNRCGHPCPHVHIPQFPFVHNCWSERSRVSELIVLIQRKAQVKTETDVDMWTKMSTHSSKHQSGASDGTQ